MAAATLPAHADWSDADEFPHAGAVDEWVFAAWTPDAALGLLSGHRVQAGRAWYWSAVVRDGLPLLHLAEWDVRVRPDPFVVKAPEMWAEHHCDAPYEQWSVGNEAYFAALDEPADALGRAYGVPTPTAMDLEWYAAASPEPIDLGYAQAGVVHGAVEIGGLGRIDLAEIPAFRWRRWSAPGGMGLLDLPAVVAHTGLRAPFAFPDGTVADWVLSPSGWARRRPR